MNRPFLITGKMIVLKKRVGTFFLFLLLVMAIYGPLMHKSFASDDFAVLRRVVFFKHGIFIKGFFRPLSDITLYFNYWLAGFDPVVYNLFNFVSHACIVYMVFLIARRIRWIPAGSRNLFSWLSALLFLTYPFHNESIVWGVGRASLMAALFGVMAMLAAVSDLPSRWKYFLASVFYFIGLSGYESIMVLPGIILLLVYDRALPLRRYVSWVVWMGVTLAVHLVVRVLVSGVLFGAYGGDTMLAAGNSNSYGLKYIKVIGRVFLPPMEQSVVLTVLFAALVVVWAIALVILWKRRKEDAKGPASLGRLSIILLLSLLIPIMFGVSTRTYEGDRLFYFPSVFTAMWIAWFLIIFFRGKQVFIAAAAVLLYQVVFSVIAVHNWQRASAITEHLIEAIKNRPQPRRRIMVVNVPQEYEGAHVLRNGFYDALWLQGVDTSLVRAVNYTSTEQMRRQPRVIRPQYKNGQWIIAPEVTVEYARGAAVVSGSSDTGFLLLADSLDTDIYYWNKEKLLPLQGAGQP